MFRFAIANCNIVSKTEYAYTLGEITEEMTPVEESHYSYGDSEWKDLLTAFSFSDSKASSNNIDTQLTYDAMGNVTSFNGATFTWNAGRQLESSQDGNDRYRYHYNENGYLSRIDMYDEDTDSYPGGYVFVWDGDRLVSRSIVYYEPYTELMTSRILYDTDGEALGFHLISNMDGMNGVGGIYLYRKNLQGDVTHIMKSDGSIVGTYEYDAWGKIINLSSLTTIAGVNPFRYRGYYYDNESGLYYINSRYYNPEWGRFLNADKHTDTGTGVVINDID